MVPNCRASRLEQDGGWSHVFHDICGRLAQQKRCVIESTVQRCRLACVVVLGLVVLLT